MLNLNRAALVSAVACILASSALAQPDTTQTERAQTPPKNVSTQANPGAGSGGLETVIVTAERRVENIQKVPVAITAIGGNELEAQSITGFKDLSTKVPSFRFGAGVTGGENVITMRGLGSQNTTPGGDSPVAYSVDGVTLQRSTAIDPEFYDLDRIEVLRGPQGTLYGRNSVGGSINIVTNHPDDEFAASADVLIGDYSARIFRGWATGPIYEDGGFQVLGRITGVSAQHDPYATNLSTAPTATHNQDAEDVQMLRGELLFNFSSDVNLLVTASVLDTKDPVATNTAWWEVPERFIVDNGDPGQPPIPLGSRCDFSTKAKFDPRTFCHDSPENASNRLQLYTATLNWNLGWAELTSVSGYSADEVSQTSDGDGSDLPIAMGKLWNIHQQQLSEEIRLASNDETSPLRWLAGFIYFYAKNKEDFKYSDTGYNDIFDPNLGGYPGAFDEFNFHNGGFAKTYAWAPFGQVDYDLGKTSIGIPLTLTAGLRFSNDTRKGFNFLDYQLPFYNIDIFNSNEYENTWSQWTGKLAARYQFTDDLMGYASVSRGYLSGGVIVGLATPYGPEHVWSYEVGFKSNWLDNRLQVNLAAFHEDISNLQVFIQSGVNSGIDNAAQAKMNGLELEAVALPIDNLRLNATVSVNDAKYEDYISADTRYGTSFSPCLSPTNPLALCDFKGNRLNQTPPYTVDLGAEYTINTSIGTFVPRADIFFSGEVFFTPPNDPRARQEPYHTTNLHLLWNDNSGRWWADAFVNNLENNDIISNDGLQSISLGQQVMEPDNYAYYPPRTFGLRVGIHL